MCLSYYSMEFVEGWSIMQTLGEGSYGEVKLLFNKNTRSAVAMKIIDLAKHPNVPAIVRKEAHIHQLLLHDNIITYYGQRQDKNYVYMFIEYASGGELFDRIEPDIGMPQSEAQKYFKQLISAVEYLHGKGIAHRDLKPENLLLDQLGNLKISDFGLATFFRVQEKERMLQNQCGTLPYVAPEVLEKPYFAEPADIWSCGIILVALLTGELPWDKPTSDCSEYTMWKNGKQEYIQVTPWSKVNTLPLSLIRKILVPNPTTRYSIPAIKSHRWYNRRFSAYAIPMDVMDYISNNSVQKTSHLRKFDCDTKLSYSQPEEMSVKELNDNKMNSGLFCFSQPTQIENLLISTQLLSSPSTSFNTNCLQKLVKRMTRFFVKTTVEESVARLKDAVEKLNYSWKSFSDSVVTIGTTDRRKSALTFKINVLIMEENTLLDFRLSKGCGLEFKRCFIAIKRELQDLVIIGSSIFF